MRRTLIAVLVLAGGAAVYLALPPPGQTRPPSDQRLPGLRGAIHIHTSRSDGTGRVEDVAAAAERAGLGFVVLTDHGDATRKPDAPRYIGRVLCIDAVEISTEDGHLVALGLPQAPYPLGGEGRDVVADVARLGGMAIAAHPDSRKEELRWRDWNVPVDGLEWLNADSQWRDESRGSLARALFTYPFRSVETLASLLDRPEALLQRWDALAQTRRIVSIAAADAHARIGLRSLGEPYDNSPSSFRVPSYDMTLRLFSNVLPQAAVTGDAAVDAATVLREIRAGHVYSTIDAIGGAGALSFTATGARARVTAGDALAVPGAVTLRADVPGRSDARLDLIRNGSIVGTATGEPLEYVADDAAMAAYRVEVSLAGAPGDPPIPWMASNPIYAGTPALSAPAAARRPAQAFSRQYGDGPAAGWTIEASSASKAALDITPATRGTELGFRYAVGGAVSSSAFAALRMPAGSGVAQFDRLVFSARADRPTRISVQLRAPGGEGGQRWHRSVYLDTEMREVAVYFDDLRPRGMTATEHPPLESVDSILFVLDTVNTPLGANGRIWIDDVKYGR